MPNNEILRQIQLEAARRWLEAHREAYPAVVAQIEDLLRYTERYRNA